MPMPGTRRLTAEALAGRSYALDDPDRSISRKELAQTAREAERALGLHPTLRLVLHELVGVWGEQELGDSRLLIWPSNEYLVARTGLSERAIRYALARLTELQLLTPRDSANGKRFAIRDRAGKIIDAFGFDLTPLIARRDEFAEIVQGQAMSAEARRRLFDEITICRRSSAEALDGLDALGLARLDLEQRFEELRHRTPRRGSSGPVDDVLIAWRELRAEAEMAFYRAANDGKDCRHKETNNGPPEESCPRAPGEGAGASAVSLDPPAFPSMQLVREACPALETYGTPRSETELVALGRMLRGSLGAHPSAWDEAAELIGPVRAAVAVILVLQLHTDDVESGTNHIKNPGGYFRAMVRMIADRRIHLETELLGLLRRKNKKGGLRGAAPS